MTVPPSRTAITPAFRPCAEESSEALLATVTLPPVTTRSVAASTPSPALVTFTVPPSTAR